MRFSRALWCARRLVQICPQNSVLYMYARAYSCTWMHKRTKGKK